MKTIGAYASSVKGVPPEAAVAEPLVFLAGRPTAQWASVVGVHCRPVDAAELGTTNAPRAIQSIAYRNDVHVVALTSHYLAYPLFGSALVVNQLTSGLAVAQDAALDKLGIRACAVASQHRRRSFAFGLRHRDGGLLGGTINLRELDQASLSQLI